MISQGAPLNDDALSLFHPVIQDWFRSRFHHPTEPQRLGWRHIAAGENTLIAAPTGSGKTLTAFLAVIDRLFRKSLAGELAGELQVIYLSPLRALSNDMERNLVAPLQEIHDLALAQGLDALPIKVGLRTGDTPSHRRAAMVKKPPQILVTTPESLFLLLTGEKSRETLRTVNTVIIDEIHALVRDKRGSHMALSIERLESLVSQPLQRIGLSATQKPISRIARFLIGEQHHLDASSEMSSESIPQQLLEQREPISAEFSSEFKTDSGNQPDFDHQLENNAHDSLNCRIVDVGHTRDLQLAVEIPPSELSCVCSHEQWAEVNQRIVELIQEHRSTLIFVNTRRLAERLTHQLSQILGEEAIASHHGSLSKEHRHNTEQRLKSGELKAVVATASLELGIDVGYIDLVIQIGSPRSIAAFLQRIGRSGHALGLVPKGHLFALTRDELVECMALIRAVVAGRLDTIPIPTAPLDILAQQIVGEVANEEWDVEELFQVMTRAWSYRTLSREEYGKVLHILSNGLTAEGGRGQALIHHDHVNGRIKGRKAARLIALNNSGAIAEIDSVRVILEDENTVVGSVDEDFAVESSAGDIFLLGNSSWRIQRLRGNDLIVADAHGAPPTIPFWRGEAPGRTIELSEEVSKLREELETQLIAAERTSSTAEPSAQPTLEDSAESKRPRCWQPIAEWLQQETQCNEFAAWQVVIYLAAQRAALGVIPTTTKIVFERFFDESGGMQLVVHAPFGSRINRAWGLAFRKRFCRSFDFELQASADDDGFILSLGPQHSFPIESLFPMMRTDNAQNLLEQALLVVPMFHLRWRWNVTRALFVARMKNGKKVPPALQRFRTEDLLTAVFPKLTGCQENIVGDHEIPDHPLVQQTMRDCLREALDIDGLIQLLHRVDAEEITYVARDTREPSPFAYELLNANPYAFLDGGEVQERRARAVATRRSLNVESVRDLGQLDPEAIRDIVAEVQPIIRDANELHDTLVSRLLIPIVETSSQGHERLCFSPGLYQEHFETLLATGRVVKVTGPDQFSGWVPVEHWDAVSLVWKDLATDTTVSVPSSVKQDWDEITALNAVLRGLIETSGPVTAVEIAASLQLPVSRLFASMIALEGEGIVLRGRFLNYDPSIDSESEQIEWCHRRVLARIHRRTISGLRSEIEPVEIPVYQKYLARHHGAIPGFRRQGVDGVFEALTQLQGLDLSSAAWEESLFPTRVEGYLPAWLDELCLAGDIGWGRLNPVAKKRTQGKPLTSVTRAVPISFYLHEDLPWLAERSPQRLRENLGEAALEILELLQSQGALFARDLLEHTNLLPTQLDELLGELVAHGWLTSDGFSGLRKLTQTQEDQRNQRRRAGLHRERKLHTNIGRWTLWHPAEGTLAKEDTIEQWGWQLLRRWGVVFRELAVREPLAPQWWELLRVYRRLEAQGEIRGGRFIKGVGGEQFATAAAVRELRSLRDTQEPCELIIVSAADPLNLTGIIGPGARIPGLAGNRVAYLDGVLVGWKKGEESWINPSITASHQLEIEIGFGLKVRRKNLELALEIDEKQGKAKKKRTPNRHGSGIPKPFPF